ncbi:hypothetical protein AVEN_93789-1 [Araneus ventricosus]|uniref:Uncharacterized protein n=1 Tax=Araneus ventricosus TaxID=182803 RepID=A0A4Y2JH15_ARAVE|nr:hypothetical protein AVEN_93789-1 [Araneus ventricosus]
MTASARHFPDHQRLPWRIFPHVSSILLIKQRCTLRSADHCADTMNPDWTANENDENNSSRKLRRRSVLSVVESLSHRNVHYFVWPRAFF